MCTGSQQAEAQTRVDLMAAVFAGLAGNRVQEQWPSPPGRCERKNGPSCGAILRIDRDGPILLKQRLHQRF